MGRGVCRVRPAPTEPLRRAPPQAQVVPTKGSITIAIPSGAPLRQRAQRASRTTRREQYPAPLVLPAALREPRTATSIVLSRSALTGIPPPAGSVVKALGALKGAAGVDFSKVHVYFTNERDGGKTFSGDRKDFLDPCGVPLANCHPITGLEDPAKGAAAYAAAMMADPKLPKVNGAPSFDIILLGTGDDGHCASINPGSAQVAATSGYVLPLPAGDKPGGATVSLALINAAARVVVSASEGKRAEMVKRALSGVFPAGECPAGLVRAAQGSTTWLCDADSIAAYKAAAK